MFFDSYNNDDEFEEQYKLYKAESDRIISQVLQYLCYEWEMFPTEDEIKIITEQFVNSNKIFLKMNSQIKYLFLETLSYFIWSLMNDNKAEFIKKNNWSDNNFISDDDIFGK